MSADDSGNLSFIERVVRSVAYVHPSIQHPGKIVQARIAHSFFVILGLAIVGTVFVSLDVIEKAFDARTLERTHLYVVGAGCLVLLGCIFLCRQGKPRTAMVILVATCQVVEISLVRLFDSPFEGYLRIFPWQLLLTAMSAFLIHPFAGFFLIPSTIFCLWVQLFGMQSDPIHFDGNPVVYSQLTNDLAIMMVVAGVCFLIARNMMAAFEQLANSNEWLEKEVRTRTRDLRLAKERAESADRAKTEFLANVSHEIRTPMTSILGYSQLLFEENLGDGERHNFVDTIRRNGEHLLGLINQILDISKIESGRFTLQNEYCLTQRIFDEVMSSMKVTAAEKRLDFNITYQSSLPKILYSDPLRLRQALLNLIGNAIKFTDEGRVEVSVEAFEEEERWKLVVIVKDTGIGIPKEMLDTVFRPFVQVDSSFSRKYGGAGLGLTITQRITEAMGGHLIVASEPGHGSTFTLTVYAGKIEPQQEKIAEVEVEEEDAAPIPDAAINGRLLLVEDGKDNQILITHILERAGLQVDLAENGLEAVEKSAKNKYDLILMDIQMPVMDGLQAARAIRQAGNEVPIIALTAYAMQRDEGMCREAGCNDFMSKPVEQATLLSKINRWIEQRRAAVGAKA